MPNQPVVTSSLVLALFVGAACERKPEPAPAADTTKQVEPTPGSAQQSVWPDGYIVVSEGEWIPVINPAGQKLEAAHKEFVAGDTTASGSDLQAAAAAMREDERSATVVQKGEIEERARKLDELAEKMTRGNSVARKAFERALTRAYREDAEVAWLYSEDEVVRPFFERPSRHSERALSLLAQHDGAAAAAEIRRSTAYFRLAEFSARSDERESLQQDVERLNAMAKQAEAGKLTPEQLRKTLAEVDRAYAASYLHQAEARYEAKDAQSARRSLREAAARMRARLHWVGREAEATSVAVVDDLEGLASTLGKGAQSAAKDVASLFQRARAQVKDEGPTTLAADHG